MDGGSETSLAELACHLARAMGYPDLLPAHAEERVVRRLADIGAAKQLIRFEPSVPLDLGLKDLVDWWRGERLEVPFKVLPGAAA